MCGICGFTRQGNNDSDEIIEEMKSVLAHRGPDDQGTFSDMDVVLGHRRLSIIDLAGGKQPLFNEDRTICVVFNGEIYNFVELRNALKKDGHRFSTQSDSEVLVHLYEKYGRNMTKHLTGMFAIALWDSKKKRLFLARDRYGQKPLYYAERKGQLIFASEMKSICCHPNVKRQIDPDALRRYLAYEYIPAPWTIFRNVYKLEAGFSITFEGGQLTKQCYWDYRVGAVPRYHGNFRDCQVKLVHYLEQAVEQQLISDVPVGVFLSGGIDSSTIVALLSKKIPPDKIKTFSIGFEERSFDETSYARMVAGHFGTSHHEAVFREPMLVSMLPKVTAQFDEPFADASAIPTYFLSQFTRQHVTVAIGGDGGDELFAGYDTFTAQRIAGTLEWLPPWFVRHMIMGMVKFLPMSDVNMSLRFRAHKFFTHLHTAPILRNQLWLGALEEKRHERLLIEKGSGTVYGELQDLEQATKGMSDTDALMYAYIKTYLQEDILTKVDRASMAHGLEVRSPFLDHHLGDFVAGIPVRWKMRGLTGKYILKESVKHLLPEKVIKRSKKGFGIPKSKWLKGVLREQAEESFSENNLKQQGLFRPEYVRKLWREHLNKEKDNQKELWTLFMFDQWFQMHA